MMLRPTAIVLSVCLSCFALCVVAKMCKIGSWFVEKSSRNVHVVNNLISTIYDTGSPDLNYFIVFFK